MVALDKQLVRPGERRRFDAIIPKIIIDLSKGFFGKTLQGVGI
jgi:hypothetical protein